VDETDDDLDPGVEDTDKAVPAGGEEALPDWARTQLTKARAEAQRYRKQVRRLELQTEFGSDVLEFVPDDLTLDKQKELAAKLQERFRAQEGSPAAETSAEPQVAPTPTELNLAAASQVDSPVGAVTKFYTPAEIQQIGLKNEAEALRLIAQGAMRRS